MLAWAKERFEVDEDELEAAWEQQQEPETTGEADIEDEEGDAGTGADDEVSSLCSARLPAYGVGSCLG